ncbi:hypothetical protein LCGC14_1088980 [marine sediment metagenome]|uniref:Uncharacterized protein n=1 Tax=marine sediment metagenome TaxID=412755 RepID=A0A0F9MHG9_9ZZZZ
MTGGFVRLGWPRRLKRVLMPMYAELPASSCCWPRASVIGWSRAHSRQESRCAVVRLCQACDTDVKRALAFRASVVVDVMGIARVRV